jgi:hypothetical protein
LGVTARRLARKAERKRLREAFRVSSDSLMS